MTEELLAHEFAAQNGWCLVRVGVGAEDRGLGDDARSLFWIERDFHEAVGAGRRRAVVSGELLIEKGVGREKERFELPVAPERLVDERRHFHLELRADRVGEFGEERLVLLD